MFKHLIKRLASVSWVHLPVRTVRFRLTLLYSSLFLVAGVGLLAITNLLVAQTTDRLLVLDVGNKAGNQAGSVFLSGRGTTGKNSTPANLNPQLLHQANQLHSEAVQQHAADLHQLLVVSAFALAIMAIFAIVLGWLMAGRVLRPLRLVTSKTQQISAHSLNERLAIDGPNDEVKDLADTIDGLLGRLETAFDAQHRFIANASHELRTPLAFGRTLLEVTLADPSATTKDLRAACREVIASGEQQERLIDGLLTLASSERGLDRWERLDLAAISHRVVAARSSDAQRRALTVDLALRNAPIIGNPDLAERLVANLVDNALGHNTKGGFIRIVTEIRGTWSFVSVSNSGPMIPLSKIQEFFNPFHRRNDDRTGGSDGHGLGLSIVHAIADAHSASISVNARPEGGLDIEVSFPISHDRITLGTQGSGGTNSGKQEGAAGL